MRQLLSVILTLLLPISQGVGGKGGIGGKAGFGGGVPISIDAHTYYARGSLTTCADGQVTSTPCTITNAFSIPTSGDAVYVVVNLCWSVSCDITTSGTISVTDGVNTYTAISAATATATSWNVYWFKSCNASTVSGANLNFVDTGGAGAERFAYASAEAVALKDNSNAACEDTSVANKATGTGTTASVTSTGNVSNAGEYGLASSFCAGQTITASGSYTALDLPGISDRPGYVQSANLPSGSTTTAQTTCSSSATWFMSIVAVK